MGTWIDFKQLRQTLSFEAVLRQYGVELKIKGRQHHGYCPLPGHKGNRNSPSFSANLEKGIFQCFGCGAKGNVLEFAALMEGVDPSNGAALREVAARLQARYGGGTVPADQRAPETPKRAESPNPALPTLVNAGLDFELKGLDPGHPYLAGRGFTRTTIEHFRLGFCSRGSLAGRIAIPLHDTAGKLVGYAGRIVDDSLISEENPRYRFPGPRERNGKRYEFRKTRLLYNASRIQAPVDDLVVVEGFSSVWWLYQHGMSDAVAMMGADCSERQAELIVSLLAPDGRLWLMPDGDEAGERVALSCMKLIAPYLFVRWVKLQAGKQPTDYAGEELRGLLGKS